VTAKDVSRRRGNRALFEQMNQADADRQQKQQRQRDGRRHSTSNVRKHPNVHPEPECGHGHDSKELLSLRSLDSGSLRIGASTTIATYMIAEYLGLFHREYPGIDLHLIIANTRDIADLMIAHEIEIALVEGPIEDEQLVSQAWRTDVMSLVVSPQHRFAASQHAIDSAELKDEVLIVREPGSGSREVVAQALASRGIEPKRTLEIGSTEAIKQTVAGGLGVSIISSATISDQVKLGRLKVVAMRDLRIERTLWQLKVPGQIEIPAATAFERIIWKDKSMVKVAQG
jgi:DNA-binding transcriptional LysR family regulator